MSLAGPNPARHIATILALALAGGCAHVDTRHAQAPAVLAHVDDIAAENGDRILVLRDYVDELKIDGRDVRRRYQYAWNYSRAVTQERVYALDGSLLQLTDKPTLTLVANDAEQAYAFSVIRADPRWAGMHEPDSLFYGGFAFRQDGHPVCGLTSRCIHVFVSDATGTETSLHVIFDLMSGYTEAPDPEVYARKKTSPSVPSVPSADKAHSS